MNDTQWKDLKKWFKTTAEAMCAEGKYHQVPLHIVTSRLAASTAAHAIGIYLQEEAMTGFVAATRKGYEDADIDLSPAFSETGECADEFFSALATIGTLMNDHTIAVVSGACLAGLPLGDDRDTTHHFIKKAIFDQTYEYFWHCIPSWVDRAVAKEYARSGVEFPDKPIERSQKCINMLEHQALVLAEDVCDATDLALKYAHKHLRKKEVKQTIH